MSQFVLQIKTTCDRCREECEGALAFHTRDEGTPPILIAASGIYVASAHWQQFMFEGEQVVCKSCMEADARYQERMQQVEENPSVGGGISPIEESSRDAAHE